MNKKISNTINHNSFSISIFCCFHTWKIAEFIFCECSLFIKSFIQKTENKQHQATSIFPKNCEQILLRMFVATGALKNRHSRKEFMLNEWKFAIRLSKKKRQFQLLAEQIEFIPITNGILQLQFTTNKCTCSMYSTCIHTILWKIILYTAYVRDNLVS